ncbi:MAG: SoxR reducing system RseC family protein [Candidatus Brocadiia bacterium]
MQHDDDTCAIRSQGREGTVIALEGDEAVVQLDADPACAKGPGCAHCAVFQSGPVTIRIPRRDLRNGDTIRISSPTYAGPVSILVVFVLPIVLGAVGLLAGSLLEPSLRLEGFGAILGGVAGLGIAIVIALLTNRRLSDVTTYQVQRSGRKPEAPA